MIKNSQILSIIVVGLILAVFFPSLGYSLKLKRDPFDQVVYKESPRFPVKGAAVTPKVQTVLQLMGIISQPEGDSIAMIAINGQIKTCKVDDIFWGVQILEIRENALSLKTKGKVYIIEIGKELTL